MRWKQPSPRGLLSAAGSDCANRTWVVNLSIRQLLLVLVFIGIVGLQVELALLRHAESFSQWIPHVTLMIGLLVNLFSAVYVSKTIFIWLLSRKEKVESLSI